MLNIKKGITNPIQFILFKFTRTGKSVVCFVSVATAPFYTKQTTLLPVGDLRR